MARAFLDTETNLEPEFVKEQIARHERNEKRGKNELRDRRDIDSLSRRNRSRSANRTGRDVDAH